LNKIGGVSGARLEKEKKKKKKKRMGRDSTLQT